MSSHTADPTVFVTITGVLYPDNRLLLEPGFATSDPYDPTGEGTSAIVAELMDEDGRILLRHRLAVASYTTDGEHLAEQAVLGKMPLPRDTSRIRFLRDGVEIHELEVPRGNPRVRLEWKPEGEVNGRQVVRWSSDHPQGAPLRYAIAYSADDGQTWQPVALPTAETEAEVDFDGVPGGRGRLLVLASDGINTTQVVTARFRVARKGLVATILSHDDGATAPAGEPLWLQGQAYDVEERRFEVDELVWESSKDGELGRGPVVMPTLSRGRHTITLRARSDRATAEVAIRLVVGRAPAPPKRRRG